MQETSLIDFLKTEISYFRELLGVIIQEELAIKGQEHHMVIDLFRMQIELLSAIKDKRPKKFQAYNPEDDVNSLLLQSLKDQLEILVQKVTIHLDRNRYLRSLIHLPSVKPVIKNKIIVETLEDEC